MNSLIHAALQPPTHDIDPVVPNRFKKESSGSFAATTSSKAQPGALPTPPN
jgi:hypothetical protein